MYRRIRRRHFLSRELAFRTDVFIRLELLVGLILWLSISTEYSTYNYKTLRLTWMDKQDNIRDCSLLSFFSRCIILVYIFILQSKHSNANSFISLLLLVVIVHGPLSNEKDTNYYRTKKRQTTRIHVCVRVCVFTTDWLIDWLTDCSQMN